MSELTGMDEDRRLSYLQAMGVVVWRPRTPDVVRPAGPLVVETRVTVEPPPRLNDHESRPLVEQDSGSAVVGEAHSTALAGGDELELHNPVTELETPAISPRHVPDAAVPRQGSEPSAAPRLVAEMDWSELAAAVAHCRACGLCETRTHTVFGVGDRKAALMIIGEAPGADEDRAGEPFVGRAGQLLTRMLNAIGLAREQVFIANVLKCRPPGNRDPRPEEILQCEVYLRRQMELVRPQLILAVGRISAQHLLRTEVSVGRLRGRWFELGGVAIPLRVTYHPAYLLRAPEQKAKAWEDLTAIARRLAAPSTGTSATPSHQ